MMMESLWTVRSATELTKSMIPRQKRNSFINGPIGNIGNQSSTDWSILLLKTGRIVSTDLFEKQSKNRRNIYCMVHQTRRVEVFGKKMISMLFACHPAILVDPFNFVLIYWPCLQSWLLTHEH
jgi:hypothetical protein